MNRITARRNRSNIDEGTSINVCVLSIVKLHSFRFIWKTTLIFRWFVIMQAEQLEIYFLSKVEVFARKSLHRRRLSFHIVCRCTLMKSGYSPCSDSNITISVLTLTPGTIIPRNLVILPDGNIYDNQRH